MTAKFRGRRAGEIFGGPASHSHSPSLTFPSPYSVPPLPLLSLLFPSHPQPFTFPVFPISFLPETR